MVKLWKMLTEEFIFWLGLQDGEVRQWNKTKGLWDEEKPDNWGLQIINTFIVGLMDPIKYNWPNFISKNSVQLA